jgi:hypothetical protein
MSKKLQFQGEKSLSIGPKLAITSWYTFVIESNKGNVCDIESLLACLFAFACLVSYWKVIDRHFMQRQ